MKDWITWADVGTACLVVGAAVSFLRGREKNMNWATTVKRCGCGRLYGEAEWRKLPRAGTMTTPADETGPEETLELRNCACGSTLAIVIAPERERT